MAVAYRTSATGGDTTGTGSRTVAIVGLTGDLIVVFAALSGIAATPAAIGGCTDDQGGTYTMITAGKNGGGVDPLCCAFVRDQLLAAGATVTATIPAAGNTAGALVAVAVSGMSRSGVSAIRSWGGQSFEAAASPAPVMTRASLTSNVVLGGVATQDTTQTEPTGWTERQDTSQITPTTALEVATRDSGHTSATVTWGASSSNAGYAIALELDGSPVSALVLLNRQVLALSGVYTPTSGTTAVRAIVVGSGGGGGPATTTAGAAGGGGSSGEWLELWYRSGSAIVGGAVTIGAGGASGGAGNLSSLVIDGLTFTAVGGLAGATSTAVTSYAEADAPALGTSGSLAYDVARGANQSTAAMASSTTTISAYTGGLGGNTPYGRGGRGSGGDADGGAGTGYGAGGGGGRRGAGTNRSGGAGAPGVVIIEEYGPMVTAADIADAVWDEARAGHVAAGSFGENVIGDVTKWSGTAVAAPTVAGVPRVDVDQWRGGQPLALTNSRPPVLTAVISNSAISAAAIATGAITNAKFAAGAIDATAIATDAIASAQLAASAVTEIQSGLATSSALTSLDTKIGAPAGASVSADIAAVKADTAAIKTKTDSLTFTVAGKVDANTTHFGGTAAAAPTVAGIPKVEVSSIVNDAITAAAIAADAIGSSELAASAVTEIQSGLATSSALTSLDTKIGAPAGASVSADIAAVKADTAAIKTKTDSLTFTVAGKVDANTTHFGGTAAAAPTVAGIPKVEVSSIVNDAITAAAIATDAIGSSELAASAVTEIQTGIATSAALATAQTSLNAIDAKTTNLPSDPADESLIIGATNAIMARLGTPAGADIAADIAAAVSAIAALPAASAVRDAVLNYEYRTGRTVRGFFRRVGSSIETATGLLGATFQFFKPDGSPEWGGTQDVSGGERTAIDLGDTETP